jgi:hypothetical protein
MSGEFHAIVFNDLNLIFATSLVRTNMEVSGVLVSFERDSDLGSLLPDCEFCTGKAREHNNNDNAQLELGRGKDPLFLNVVEEVNHNLAILLLLGMYACFRHQFFKARLVALSFSAMTAEGSLCRVRQHQEASTVCRKPGQ